MAYEMAYQVVTQIAHQVEHIPVAFVHVPGTGYLGVMFAKHLGIFGVALQREPFVPLEVNHSKYLPFYAKHQRGFVEGKILCHSGQCEAVISYTLYIHGLEAIQKWYLPFFCVCVPY